MKTVLNRFHNLTEEKFKGDCWTCKAITGLGEISFGLLEGLLPRDHECSLCRAWRSHRASCTFLSPFTVTISGVSSSIWPLRLWGKATLILGLWVLGNQEHEKMINSSHSRESGNEPELRPQIKMNSVPYELSHPQPCFKSPGRWLFSEVL